eukprot:GHVL01015044.1.p1 GENE.GHVL01015044.1~~GHVL01015044.1.p1  ORF type:complete len:286 (-),score=59.32 GHVL01015044.1:207-1064(-)
MSSAMHMYDGEIKQNLRQLSSLVDKVRSHDNLQSNHDQQACCCNGPAHCYVISKPRDIGDYFKSHSNHNTSTNNNDGFGNYSTINNEESSIACLDAPQLTQTSPYYYVEDHLISPVIVNENDMKWESFEQYRNDGRYHQMAYNRQEDNKQGYRQYDEAYNRHQHDQYNRNQYNEAYNRHQQERHPQKCDRYGQEEYQEECRCSCHIDYLPSDILKKTKKTKKRIKNMISYLEDPSIPFPPEIEKNEKSKNEDLMELFNELWKKTQKTDEVLGILLNKIKKQNNKL